MAATFVSLVLDCRRAFVTASDIILAKSLSFRLAIVFVAYIDIGDLQSLAK